MGLIDELEVIDELGYDDWVSRGETRRPRSYPRFTNRQRGDLVFNLFITDFWATSSDMLLERSRITKLRDVCADPAVIYSCLMLDSMRLV